jgi:predicted PurR-regulated permease PerM
VENQRLLRILLVLLIILAAVFLAQMLWQFLSGYADLILLFLLAWLVSFVLNPLVLQVSERPIPHMLVKVLEPRIGMERAKVWYALRLPRGTAVFVVYVCLLLIVIVLVGMLTPIAVTQLSQLTNRMPEYMARAPEASGWAQSQLSRLGINLKVQDAVNTAVSGLQGYAAALIQNVLGIFTSVVSILANFFFVFILGFYITLDGPRLRNGFAKVIPTLYKDEIEYLGRSIDRTFGGFIRGQLLQALLQMIGTAVVMTVFGLNFVLIATLFAGLFMLIPLVGPFLAVIPPLLAALVQSPGASVWVVLILIVFQFIVVNVLMPRVISDAIGLHPLLVFASLLVSIKVAGFWGAFFGIPIAGVLWAMAMFFFGEWRGENQGPDRVVDHDVD